MNTEFGLEDESIDMPSQEQEDRLLEEACTLAEKETPADSIHPPTPDEPTPTRKRLGNTSIVKHTNNQQTPTSPPIQLTGTPNPSPYNFRIVNLLQVHPHSLLTAHALLDDVERYIAEHLGIHQGGHTPPIGTTPIHTPLATPPSTSPALRSPIGPSLLGTYVDVPKPTTLSPYRTPLNQRNNHTRRKNHKNKRYTKQ